MFQSAESELRNQISHSRVSKCWIWHLVSRAVFAFWFCQSDTWKNSESFGSHIDRTGKGDDVDKRCSFTFTLKLEQLLASSFNNNFFSRIDQTSNRAFVEENRANDKKNRVAQFSFQFSMQLFFFRKKNRRSLNVKQELLPEHSRGREFKTTLKDRKTRHSKFFFLFSFSWKSSYTQECSEMNSDLM